ncbi:hypothetical protein A946_11865 [Methylacidiphilum kamchatkense Kam1]|uniref:DUF2442 domain-containing protein n=1 Tax=Methylacidiphilum kamchatkense Kam1 TaxID=1202785 RepID=A0ABR4ZW36_9BACT|nr:hypothetical protein A946_11865 [Methylacidiphilum kamchatkense Kam1]
MEPSQLGHCIRSVQVISRTALRLTFDEGEIRSIDLAPWMQPGTALERIGNDEQLFRQVFIRGRTIEWPDGATLDPDVLYWMATPNTTL